MPRQLLEEPSQRRIEIGDQSTYIISDIYNYRKDGTHLEILSYFTDKTLEGEFTNEELGRFLVTTNFTEGDGSRAETMRLLHTTCCGLRNNSMMSKVTLINDEGRPTVAVLRAALEASCLRGAFPGRRH